MAPSLIEPESLHTTDSSLKSQQTNAFTQPPEHEEYQYLNLIREILNNGEHRPDR
jgi:thymidylate synthase